MGCLYTIFVRPFVILLDIVWDLLKLVPYVVGLLLLWLVFTYFTWGNFDFLDGSAITGWFSREPAASATITNTNTTSSPQVAHANYRIIFRFIWQGEMIYYLGNQIDEDYFYEVARQAKELNGKVEVQQQSDVPAEVANRRRAELDQIGVAYEIIMVDS